MAPRFSVVIPVFNRASSVLPILRSVQDQTFRDFECIVVDDGSSDGEELRKMVEGLGDPRFRYVHRKNGGGGAARNTGIDEARGDIIAFLDSDDRWLPEKLAIQLRQLEASPDAIAYCQCLVDRGVGRHWVRPSRGIRSGEDIGEYLFVANQFIQTSTIALAASTARQVRWDPGLARCQDLDLVLRLFAAGKRFAFWPEALVIWSDSSVEGRTSHTTGLAPASEFLRKNDKLLGAKARKGFSVTYLAYDLAKERPAAALRALVAGAASGVPLRVVGRQFLRAFMPRRFYRALVDSFVGALGR